jgi:peptidoglycan/LPS O-acetylase OafA/YrhL
MRGILQKWFFFHDDKKDHNKALDGLRGIAVIMVLLSHSSNHGIYLLHDLRFNGIGIGGVYLFFMLSAYLLDQQITMALRQHTADIHFWKRYFLRRFIRIYPLFCLALLFYLGLTTIGLSNCIGGSKDILHHLFLLDGCSVFWSIPVEFKYYFLSPLLLWFCHKYLRWDLMKISLVLFGLAAGFLIGDYFFDFDKISTIKYLIVFLTGTFIAIFYLLQAPPNQESQLDKWIGWAGFIALALSFFLNVNYVGHWMGFTESNLGRKCMLIYVVLCGTMLSAALYDKRYFRQFLEIKFLRFIGVISYSLYLFHLPVLYVLQEKIIVIPSPLEMYFFLGITIVLAMSTYLLVERPLSFIQYRKRSSAEDAFFEKKV